MATFQTHSSFLHGQGHGYMDEVNFSRWASVPTFNTLVWPLRVIDLYSLYSEPHFFNLIKMMMIVPSVFGADNFCRFQNLIKHGSYSE